MVNLVGKQYDYCVNQCFSTSLSAVDIEEIIRTTMIAASKYRFNIISIIADGAQCNRQFQKRYFIHGNKGMENTDYTAHMVHPITSQPVYYISDPSHMIKKCVSSLSSKTRNIFMQVNGEDHQLSLSIMMDLWLSFNDHGGLNRFKEFKMIDFVKNSFQCMRVGPCIKVLGPHMIEMIDVALQYKIKYAEFNDNPKNNKENNPYSNYKDAEKYGGWRIACVWFSKLFSILNSTEKRLNTGMYAENLQFLQDFYDWFKSWKLECIARTLKTLNTNHTSYEEMTGFFTAEATEDCLSMLQGIIQMTKYYCNLQKSLNRTIYFLPRRISQDLVENGFARVRLGTKHCRLDHITTSSSCTKINVSKEVKSSERSNRKRNIEGIEDENNEEIKKEESWTEYVTKCKENAIEKKKNVSTNGTEYVWEIVDGIEILTLK